MRPFGILLAACLIVLPIVTQRASAEPELKVNDLIESGKTAFKAGNYRVCEQIFQKTLSLCKRNSLIAKEISAYRWLIWTYTDQHKFAKAEELCSKEIEYITRLNKARHYLVEVLSIRGLLECDENKLVAAEKTLLEAQAMSEKADCDNTYRTGPSILLGLLRFKQFRYADSVEQYERAWDCAESNNFDFVLRGKIAAALAPIYVRLNEVKKAIELYKTVISNFSKSEQSNQQGQASVLTGYAMFLKAKNNGAEAKEYFQKAFKVFRKYGSTNDDAMICQEAYASLLRDMNDEDTATAIEKENLTTSQLSIAAEVTSPAISVVTSISKAQVEYSRKNFLRSEELFEKAMEMAASSSQIAKSILAHQWFVKSLIVEGKFKEAEKSCERQIEVMKTFSDSPHYLVQELCVMGTLLSSEGKLQKALETFQSAKHISDAADCEATYKCAVLMGLASVKNSQKDWVSAAKLFEEAIALVETSNNFDYGARSEGILALAKIYKLLNKSENEAKLYKSALANYDLNEEIDQTKVAEIFTKYAFLLSDSKLYAEAENSFREADQIFVKLHNTSAIAKRCRDELIRLTKRDAEAKKIETLP